VRRSSTRYHGSGLLNDSQRQATRRGRIAGSSQAHRQRTTRRRAYGLDKKKDELIACTTSARTFDIHPEVGENVVEVVSTRRHAPGGDDIDVRIMDWLIASSERPGHRRVQGQDGAAAPARGSEKAKIELSR